MNGDIFRDVVGYRLNEWDKQQYKKYINQLTKKFYPKVDTADMDLCVKFVPVLSQDKKYVIKIVVKRGQTNFFYSFRHRFPELDTDINMFFRRNDCETKQVINMAQIYEEILRRSKLQPSSREPIQTSKVTESGDAQYWIR